MKTNVFFKKMMKKTLTVCAMLLMILCISAAKPVQSQAASLNKKATVVTVGKQVTLKMKGVSKKKKVKWISSNKSIATVSSKGIVKGKKAGKTTITARVGKKNYKCTVTVRNNKVVNSNPLGTQINGNGLHFILKEAYYKNNTLVCKVYICNNSVYDYYYLNNCRLQLVLDGKAAADGEFGYVPISLDSGYYKEWVFTFHGNSFKKNLDLGAVKNFCLDCDYN